MKRTIYEVLFFVTTSFCILSCTSGQKDKGGDADSSQVRADSDSSTIVNKTDPGEAVLSEKNAEVSAQWLLIPGVSAGLTKLNSNEAELIKRLGKPDGGDAAMGKSVAVWYANHDTTAHSLSIYTSTRMGVDDKAKIKQIRVTSPDFKTKEGLCTASSLADIKKVFAIKKTESYKDARTNYSVYDSGRGIAFEVTHDSKCVAIIIHEAGALGQTTYSKFRTTSK